MSNIFSSRLFRSNVLMAVFGAGLLTLALLGTPKVTSLVKAEDGGCQAFDRAQFNPFPVSWTNEAGTNCEDFPVIAGDVIGWHTWMDNMNANVGDEIYVRVYMHNGAASNSGKVLHNASYSVSYDQNAGTQHTISTQLSADEDSKTGQITINTPDGAHLELESGDPLSQNIGDMQPCFEFSRVFYMTFKVVGGQNVTPPASTSGSIQAVNNNVCPASVNVSWSTQNAGAVAVFNDQTGAMISGDFSSSGINDPGVQDGQSYTYSIYNVDWSQNPVAKLSKVATSNPVVAHSNCSTPSTPSTTGTISATNSNTCPAGINVSWNTQNANAVAVFNDVTGAMISGDFSNGGINDPGVQAGQSYTYSIWNVDWSQNPVKKISKVATSNSVAATSSCTTPTPTTPTATLNISTPTQISGQCLWTATVSWNTSNVQHPTVYVIDPVTGENKVFSREDNGSQDAPWLSKGYLIHFQLRGDNIQTIDKIVDTRSFTCAAPTPTASLDAALGSKIDGQCVWNANVSWTTSNVIHPTVYVIDPATGTQKTFSAQDNGNQTAPWITPGNLYRFLLKGDNIQTIEKDVDGRNLSCTTPPPAQCVVNVNASVAIASVAPTNSPYSTTVTWKSTGNNVTIYMNGSTPITSGGANGSVQVNNLQPGTPYTFSAKDNLCGNIIASNSIIVQQVQQQTQQQGQQQQQQNQQTNNCTNSTCTNQNNNTAQQSTGNYSPNQNNSSNINGNNNTVTQTNNNCVNNSCNNVGPTAVYYVTSAGTTVSYNNFSQLSITKQVRDVTTGTSLASSVNANNGDTVEYQITVSNSGGQTANNVRVTDSIPSGLNFQSGSTYVSGSYVTDSFQNGGSMYLGSLASGASKTIIFRAQVNSGSNSSVQNTATASADNASQVQASAWVFVSNVLGGNVNLTFSKRAFNETKNVDATTVNASKQDFITYTLTVNNTGNAPATSFVITDDLSQVLPYADMVDNGGGTVNGNVITYPGITIPAGGSVSKSFKVRVKFFLADNLSYVMTNTYGNTVTVKINQPQVLGAFVAPKTGADTLGFVFAGFLTLSFGIIRKKNLISKLILNN